MARGYIIAEEEFLGEFSERGPTRAASDWSSQAYFCCECGEVWARRINLNKDGTPRPFRAYYATCRKHTDPWTISGALTTHDFNPETHDLPPGLIQREFEIYLNLYEKMI